MYIDMSTSVVVIWQNDIIEHNDLYLCRVSVKHWHMLDTWHTFDQKCQCYLELGWAVNYSYRDFRALQWWILKAQMCSSWPTMILVFSKHTPSMIVLLRIVVDESIGIVVFVLFQGRICSFLGHLRFNWSKLA